MWGEGASHGDGCCDEDGEYGKDERGNKEVDVGQTEACCCCAFKVRCGLVAGDETGTEIVVESVAAESGDDAPQDAYEDVARVVETEVDT